MYPIIISDQQQKIIKNKMKERKMERFENIYTKILKIFYKD
jgi:hypothetical protein